MYATPDDILTFLREARIAELTADSGSVADEDMLTAVIQSVSDEMDSYFPQYVTPLTSPDALRVVKPHCCKIVVNRLFVRGLIAGDNVPGTKETYDWLKEVQKGGSVVGATPRAAGDTTVTVTSLGSEEQVFGEDAVL